MRLLFGKRTRPVVSKVLSSSVPVSGLTALELLKRHRGNSPELTVTLDKSLARCGHGTATNQHFPQDAEAPAAVGPAPGCGPTMKELDNARDYSHRARGDAMTMRPSADKRGGAALCCQCGNLRSNGPKRMARDANRTGETTYYRRAYAK